MANSQNKITFEIGFVTNSHGLGELKKQLNEIRQMATSESTIGMGTKEIQSMIKSANDLEHALNGAFDIKLNTVNIQKFQQLLKQSGTSLSQIQKNLALAGPTGQSAFLKATAGLMQFNTAAKQTNQFLDKIATSFANTVRWTVMSSIVNRISGTIQKSYYYIKDLDTALNDIRIVTGKSADEMDRFAVQANNAAKELAVTTKEYTEGALIYYQQGLNDETVKELTDITAKTSNVTGQSMAAISEQLTAVWNGYQVANQAAKEGMQAYEEYVDKMAAVGATTASDLEELSVAMSKVASAASSMGVGFDDLNAQIATIVSVTRQAPESVGTALKTIYARLGDLKVDGVDEFGTKLGEISSQLQVMGINVVDSSGKMRDMSDVIAEVAEKWDTWTEAQKQAAAIAMAGKRQYNNLVALFDNWDMYGEALETSMNAAGTLEEQQEIALDSLKNKMDQLTATAEDLYDSLYDENSLKNLITGLTKLIQLLTSFSNSIGGLTNLLPALGATALRVFSNQIGNGLNTIISNFKTVRNEEKMMEENIIQLKALYSDSSLFTSAGDSSINPDVLKNNIEQLVTYYTNMQKYQNIMTQEQKDTYKAVLDNIVKVGELNNQIDQGTNALKKQQGIWGLIDVELVKDKDQLGEFASQINKTNIIAGKIQETLSLNDGQIDAVKYIQLFKDLQKEANLSDKEIKALREDFSEIWKMGKNGLSIGDALEKLQEKLQESGKSASEINKITQEFYNLNNGIISTRSAMEESLNSQKLYSNISNIIGSIGQLASSFNTIKNLGSIWTDENISDGEKFLQTVMNLSFALPMLTSSLTKLASVFHVNINLIQAWTTANKAATLVTEAETKAEELNALASAALSKQRGKKDIEQIARKIALTKGLTEAEIEELAVEENRIIFGQKTAALGSRQIAYIKARVLALYQEAAAENAAAQAAAAHKAAMLGTGVGIAIAVVTALVAALLILHKRREQQLQDTKENIEADLNEIKSKEEIINSNKDLVQSYNKLYKEYQDNKEVKNDLYEKTLELADAYGIEDAAILALGEKYDILKNKIAAAREEELKEGIQASKEGAKKAAEHAIIDADKGKGKYNEKNGQYSIELAGGGSDADYNPVRTAEINAMQATNFEGFTNIGSGYARYNYNISFNIDNPQEVKNYIDQLRKAKESLEASLENPYDSDLYKQIREELGQLSEYEKEINEQLKERYTLESELAVLNNKDRFSGADSLSKYYDIIKDIKNSLSEIIPEKEIDKYLKQALKDVDNIGNSYEKIVLATKIAESQIGTNASKDELEKAIKENLALIEGYNDRQLATLDIYFNPDADGSLKDWLNKNQWLFDLAGKTQAKVELQGLLSGFASSGKFDKENLESLFSSAEMEERLQKAWEQYSAFSSDFSKEAFMKADTDDQAIASIYAYIDAVKDLEKNKKAYIDQYDYEIQELEKTTIAINDQYGVVQVAYNEADEYVERFLKAAIAGTELEDKYNDLTEAIQNYGTESYNTDFAQQQLIKDLLKSGEVTQEDIYNWQKLLNVHDETESKINALTDAMHEAENAEYDVKEMTTLINGAIKETNTELDNLQSNLKSLIEIVSNYNETGHFTVDNVQALMTMEDALVASLDISSNSITINEDAIKNNTIAKLANLRVEALAIYQKEQERIADMKTTDATIEYTRNVLLADAAVNGMSNTIKENIKVLDGQAAALHEAFQLSGQYTEQQKALEEINYKAYQNRTKAIDDAMSEVNKGGYNFRRAMGTPTQADKDKEKQQKKTDKEKKRAEDEIDRYWEINKALEKVADALKKLDKIKSHVFGKQKIQALEAESKLIKQQTELYRQLYEEQKKEAEELKGKLSAGGAAFSAEGEVLNYGAAMQGALDTYNKAVEEFNAGLIDDQAFKIAEDNYEKFKKDMDRYDKLFYTEMKNTREKIEEEAQKLRDIELEKFEIKVQLKIDKAQLRKDFRNFRKELEKDFTLYYEVLPNTKDFKKNFKDDKAQVKAYMEAAKEVQHEIDIIMAGGTSTMFASLTEAQEKLKEINKSFEEASKNTMQDVEDAWNNYIAMIDQANEKLEQQEKRLERVNEKLDSFKQIVELAYGKKAYDKFHDIFEQQLHNNQAQVETAIKETETYKKLFEEQIKIEGANRDDMSTWSEAATKYYEEWMDSEQKITDLTAERIQLLKDDYLNTLSQITDELEKQLTAIETVDEKGNKITISVGFDIAEQEWELAEKQADLFYNSTEKAYQMQSLSNKIQKDIDKSSLSSQKKLQAFRNEQLAAMNKEKVLSKYQVEAAQAKYDILLKQIALEEAQNNKTSMKLTRNAEGNWSYQYVADEDDIKDKQQDLLDSWENLRKMSQEGFDDSASKLREYNKIAEEALSETHQQLAEGLIDKEQYEYKIKMIMERYYQEPTGIIPVLQKQYQDAKNDLILSEIGVRQEVYNQDQDNYIKFTDAEKTILDGFRDHTKGDFLAIESAVKENYKNIQTETEARMGEEGSTYTTWNTATKKMADRWSNDKDGIKKIVTDSLEKMKTATFKYKEEVTKTVKQAGLDWDTMKGKIADTKKETDEAKKAVTNYCNEINKKLPNAAKKVQEMIDAWNKVKDSISAASLEIEEYLKKQQDIKTPSAPDNLGSTGSYNGYNGNTTRNSGPTYKYTPSGGGTTTSNSGYHDWMHKGSIYIDAVPGSYDYKFYKNQDGTDFIKQTSIANFRKDYPIDKWYLKWVGSGKGTGFASGGYTGTWSNPDTEDNGRLAVLHQKELVLNAKDTENFLSATDTLRNLVSLDSSIEKSIANAISKMLVEMSHNPANNINTTSSNSENTNNIFNINAEFPNANDVNEIREAILSLPNLASQYIHRTGY